MFTADERIKAQGSESHEPQQDDDALFVADWDSLAMIHLEVQAEELQAAVPFDLDTFGSSAFVSLVFFTMRNMRLARGPRLLDLLFLPFREQHFLNVRTYVRCRAEPGIHFLTEWLSNPLCVRLGPPLYSLPYRLGKQEMNSSVNGFRASVVDVATRTALRCELQFTGPFRACSAGSLDEFLFERYAAFNAHGGRPKSFRAWHAPWAQCRCEPAILDDSLLRTHFPWFAHAGIAGANFSPGVREVWMGWPRRMNSGSPKPVEHTKLLAATNGKSRAHFRSAPRRAEAQVPVPRA